MHPYSYFPERLFRFYKNVYKRNYRKNIQNHLNEFCFYMYSFIYRTKKHDLVVKYKFQ